jgi:hypothetical protein
MSARQWTIYKSGTDRVKAYFDTEEEAREYHALHGGDFSSPANLSEETKIIYCVIVEHNGYLEGDGYETIYSCHDTSKEAHEECNKAQAHASYMKRHGEYYKVVEFTEESLEEWRKNNP